AHRILPGLREVVDRGHDGVWTVDGPRAVDHLAGVFDLLDSVGNPDDTHGVVHGCHDTKDLRAVAAVRGVWVVDAVQLRRAVRTDDVFLIELRPALRSEERRVGKECGSQWSKAC